MVKDFCYNIDNTDNYSNGLSFSKMCFKNVLKQKVRY